MPWASKRKRNDFSVEFWRLTPLEGKHTFWPGIKRGMDHSMDKVNRYRSFWGLSEVSRPLIGFSLGGWFPLQSYRRMDKFLGRPDLRADELNPEDFLDDYERLVASWQGIEDDAIRTVAPLPPFPWLEAMLGCRFSIGAEAFPYNALHLHLSSLHLMDEILAIEPLKCLQINKDVGDEGAMEKMIPHLKKVQQADKALLVRGKLTVDDLKLLCKELSPRGLYLQLVVEEAGEIGQFAQFFQPWR